MGKGRGGSAHSADTNGKLSLPAEQKDMAVPSVPSRKNDLNQKRKGWYNEYTSLSSLGRRSSQHPTDLLIPLCRRMPGHPGAPGDSPVAGHVGVELHVRPDLLLRFGEFIRRSDAPHFVPQGLPLRVHLLNQHLQFRLALLPGVGVDAFGVLDAIRPGGGVAAFEQVVVDLGNTPRA